MKELNYKITDPQGIHARPAGVLIKEAASFNSKITVEKSGRTVDAKRILGLMSLGVKCGDEITIRADGEDETEAINKLEKIMKSNF